MAYYNDDISNEEVFEGIPCEFCGGLFPFEEIVIHETGCDYNLVQVIEPLGTDEALATPEIKTETPSNIELKLQDELLKFIEAPIEKEKVSLAMEKTPVVETLSLPKKNIPKKEKAVKDNFQEFEVLEDHLLENETFTFASGGSKDKKVEKEIPSFKTPPIPSLVNNEMKKINIQNNLPDSDNEESESLENFWKRADVKLAQRLRDLEIRNQTVS